MDTTLLDRIKYSLQFNESLMHNIFLAITLVVNAIILLSFVALIIKMTKRSSRVERKTGNILSFSTLFLVIFPLGLFLLIDVSLSTDGSAAATTEAISYEQDGKQVTAMITNRFTANSSVRGIVSGSSTSSIIAFEPETGKKTVFTKNYTKEVFCYRHSKTIICQ
ncbi:hypothetical protein HCJ66_03745 [Listeria sp. FSL L7-1582]|uniref:hypothetical protein n=1 Tax=Listeria portnoyi TaxID=2713504 RepID=UPI00164E1EC8|nr:hypothetical protein [Listeria portnoyi]MBC6308663.1 hypothetical protein [Listeria portnoyi]